MQDYYFSERGEQFRFFFFKCSTELIFLHLFPKLYQPLDNERFPCSLAYFFYFNYFHPQTSTPFRTKGCEHFSQWYFGCHVHMLYPFIFEFPFVCDVFVRVVLPRQKTTQVNFWEKIKVLRRNIGKFFCPKNVIAKGRSIKGFTLKIPILRNNVFQNVCSLL